MSDKTDPCRDPMSDLGDILHRCNVTIPIQFDNGRGVLGMSFTPIETPKIMSTHVFFCLFAEKENSKYNSIARIDLTYEGAQQIKAFIEKLPEQIFNP